MSKKILVATNNQGKVAELLRLVDIKEIALVTPKEIGLADFDVEETGTTFEENALLKAREFALAAGLPAIADDSGLEVAALNGEPGLYSKRYAGENADDAYRIQFLLDKLKDVPAEKRQARFVAVLALVEADGTVVATVPGYCYGSINFAPRGTNGFGYDPIFVVDGTGGRTMAELSDQEKDAVSHRGNAARAIRPKILEIL
jgi:XTP/dITP diphosphohydrolase